MCWVKTKRIASRLFLIPLILLAAIPFSLIGTSASYAATAVSGMSLDDQVRSYELYTFMSACFASSKLEQDAGKVASGQLFDQTALGSTQVTGYYLDDLGFKGSRNCDNDDNSQISRTAMDLWGIDPLALVCYMGYSRTDGQSDPSKCHDGSNGFQGNGILGSIGPLNGTKTFRDKFQAYVKSKVGNGVATLSGAENYLYYKKTLIAACTSGKQVAKSAADFSIKSVDSGGKNTWEYYIASGDKKGSSTISLTSGDKTCDQMAKLANDNFDAYAAGVIKEAAQNACKNLYNDSGETDQYNACVAGATHRDDTTYCKDTYTNKDLAKACTDGATADLAIADDTTGSNAGSSATTCAVNGIGWIACPVMTAVSGAADFMYSHIISGILQVQPISQSSGDYTYKAWAQVRDLANIVVVVAFLFIIFSQATGVGISNYGIKRMLPKIIIGVIALNASYFIMSLVVDLSNVLGKGLYQIFVGLAPSVSPNWSDVITILLAGGALAVAAAPEGITALAIAVLPILLIAVLGILAAFITLFIRNALIIILIIIAPLAIAAYMLPNTESWFTKWRKLLTSMLLLYPMAAILFGGAKFAGSVLYGKADLFNEIIGLFVMAAPLFALPWLAKSSGGILGNVFGRLQGLANKAKAPATKALDPYRSAARNNHLGGDASRLNVGRRVAQNLNQRHFNATQRANRLEGEHHRALNRELGAAITETDEHGDPTQRAQRLAQGMTLDTEDRPQALSRVRAQALSVVTKEEKDNVDALKVLEEEAIRRQMVNGVGMADAIQARVRAAAGARDYSRLKAIASVGYSRGVAGIDATSNAIGAVSQDLLTDVDGNPSAQNEDLESQFRSYLMEVHGKDAKTRRADFYAYIRDGVRDRSYAETQARAGTYANKTAEEWAGQTPEAVRTAVAAQGLDTTTIRSVLLEDSLVQRMAPSQTDEYVNGLVQIGGQDAVDSAVALRDGITFQRLSRQSQATINALAGNAPRGSAGGGGATPPDDDGETGGAPVIVPGPTGPQPGGGQAGGAPSGDGRFDIPRGGGTPTVSRTGYASGPAAGPAQGGNANSGSPIFDSMASAFDSRSQQTQGTPQAQAPSSSTQFPAGSTPIFESMNPPVRQQSAPSRSTPSASPASGPDMSYIPTRSARDTREWIARNRGNYAGMSDAELDHVRQQMATSFETSPERDQVAAEVNEQIQRRRSRGN